ncbi:uncharacterized protein LOC108108707 [Drosophila eugracilis]|uniref:uncharacterized protein LOC108108707 n=1 Tax=Drosophila eugracilis TaxID=29029 RepID=UPI001BDA99CF|nr:uncharacterized protein LOC108108707 [Drosophila eugracilis]
MEIVEVTVPPVDSHWSLKFVDIWKPFPKKTLANATYKVIRFFYPPFALEKVNVTQVVEDPELNALNVGLFLLPLLVAFLVYGGYKYLRKESDRESVQSRVVREEPPQLDELEERMKTKYGPEYKQGIWKRKDIPDPPFQRAPLTSQSTLDYESQSSYDIELPESMENTKNLDAFMEKPNFTFGDEVKSRLFLRAPQMDHHSELDKLIRSTVEESSGLEGIVKEKP